MKAHNLTQNLDPFRTTLKIKFIVTYTVSLKFHYKFLNVKKTEKRYKEYLFYDCTQPEVELELVKYLNI